MGDTGILSAIHRHSVRTTILGILLGIYPLAQFVTAPIWGALSDRFGRKLLLASANIGLLVGNALMALGIMALNLPIVLASRLLTGMFSGSLSVTQSAMADISDSTNRTANFGLLGAMMGASLAIGPAVGGILSDTTKSAFLTLATPFWAATVLCLCNFLQILLLFHETLDEKNRQKRQSNIWSGFESFVDAFTNPNFRLIFIVIFLLGFGFNFFTQFFQYYLIERFQITNTHYGILYAYIGVWSIITQMGIVRIVAGRFASVDVLPITLLLLALVFPLILVIPTLPLLYCVVLFIPLTNGLNYPNLLSIISELADKRAQGRIMGINQSVNAVAMFLAPLSGGVLVSLDYTMPLWITFILIFGSWLMFLLFYRKTKRRTNVQIKTEDES